MLCRLCCGGCKYKYPLDIFRYDENLTWKQLIQKYLPLQLEQTEIQATTICQACRRSLSDFHVFFLHVEQCQLSFKDHIISPLEGSKGVETVDEVIKIETEDVEILSDVGENYGIQNEAENQTTEGENGNRTVQADAEKMVQDKEDNNAESIVEIIKEGEVENVIIPTDAEGMVQASEVNDTINIVEIIKEEVEEVNVLNYYAESYEILNEAENQRSEAEAFYVEENYEQTTVKTEIFEEEIITETLTNTSSTDAKQGNADFDYSTDDSVEVRAFASNDEIEYKCKVCGKIFDSFNGLMNHMPKFHKHLKPFACKTCGLAMRFKYELQRHMLVAHKSGSSKDLSEADNEANRTCAVCNIKLKSPRSLSRHMQSKHKGIKPYACERCKRKFTNKITYDLHILCPECPKAKARDMDGIEYRTCEVCGKIFGSVNSLKGHVYKYHNGIQPYECEKCKRKFDLKQTLERHKLKSCPAIAPEVFVSKNESGKEPNTCNICFKKFDQFSSFYQHMSASHKGIKPFKCETCGKAYKIKKSLSNHLKTAHKTPK